MPAQMIINKREPWQDALAQASITVEALFQQLQLPLESVYEDHSFPLRVPPSFIRRMEAGNRQDPLLLQVLPQRQEQQPRPGFVTDPLQEAEASPVPGLLHKYKSRVLLVVTGGCAVHCRYCFRRHFPYDEHALSKEQWQQIKGYLQSHPEVNEVIFSGGDPLLLKDATLAKLFADIATIPHICRIRIHTRIPVVLPERLTVNFWRTLADSALPIILVLHSNHANEINGEVVSALAPAAAQRVTLLNQAVLLAGINDSTEAQANLSEALFAAGVLPYYLHLLDPVQGASHFDVPEQRAVQLMQALLRELPGFLVPKLVREEAGKKSKSWVSYQD
jgi:EF-P beta-lysylation protein EpmB